jgi:hypothetical protein
MPRGQSAWLVRWEWSGAHAAVADELAAILRPRLSRRVIGEVVQTLYSAHIYAPTELALWARRPNDNPYQAQWHDDHCFCGGNPSLHASYVRNLRIRVAVETGLETVSWIYPPLYRANAKTTLPEQIRGDLAASITRTITGPLSQREIGR